ncbi:uncharacterized protein LOC143486122 [Brachyhypopomus gauderio]|uniref:uncharacterized protein LOC143486122 n=1 Tax=Brachyhypopomus gauderio TaxID=698409 RepID=UPI004042035C
MKYLCRGACSILSLKSKDIPVQSGSAAKDERFSLNDDTAGRVFTVTITDLRSEDGGTYWCAIQRTLHDLYTEMDLLVETQQVIASQRADPTHVSPSPAAQTTSVRNESTHVSPSTSVTTVLSVCLPLLLSGLALGILVLYCKRRRATCTFTDAYPLRRTQKGTRTHKDGNHYESELPGMRHVYQHLQLDTNQSDSVYQSLQLEITEYDSVYQTLTPQTTQSETVQKATSTKLNCPQSTVV